MKKGTLLVLCGIAAISLIASPAMASILFYDGFDSGLSNWKIVTGTATISNSVVTLSNPSVYTLMKTTQTFPANTVMLAYGSISSEKLGQGLGYYVAGNYVSFFSGSGRYRFGAATTVRSYTLNYFDASAGNHLWEINRGTNSATFKVDGKVVGITTTNIPQANLPISVSSNYPNREVKLDWVMVLEV